MGYPNDDLSQTETIQELIENVQQLGPIDILVNNAGVRAGVRFVAPIEEFPIEKNLITALNHSAAFHTTRAVFTSMKEHGYGRIINTASAHVAWSPRPSRPPMSRPSTASSA